MSDSVKPAGYNTPIPTKIMTPDRVETRIGDPRVRRRLPHRSDGRTALRPPRLPAGCRGVPQRRPGGVAGGDARGDGGGRRHGLPPGRHPRPPAGLGAAVPDRQHRHRVRVGHPRPRARRPDRRRDPARLRPDDRQRRVVPVHHRHGPAGPGSRRGGQVPDRPGGLRRARPRRVLRVGVAVADQLADRCAACSSTASPTRRPRTSTRVCASTRCPRWTLRRQMEFISLSEKAFNTIHANDVSFFDELDAVIQREPLGVIDPEIRGLLASIGISKGTPVRARRPHARAAHPGGRRRQRHRPRHRTSRPATPRRTSTRTVGGRPASSATTTGGSATTAWAAATSTPGRCSSTSRP